MTVHVQVAGAWGADVHVVLAGLTNTYSSYVTTFEEYSAQRYEGASTIFGPHTLDAYIQVNPPLLCSFALASLLMFVPEGKSSACWRRLGSWPVCAKRAPAVPLGRSSSNGQSRLWEPCARKLAETEERHCCIVDTKRHDRAVNTS